MSFGNKLKKARLAKKMTQKQLADIISVKHNSISNWENDINKPDPDTIELLCGVLEITPNYLLATNPDDFSPADKLLIKRFNELDDIGKKHVETIIDWESDRISLLSKQSEQLKEKAERIAELEIAVKRTSSTIRLYTYMHKIAAAGTGFYFDDIPTDTIAAPYVENADFIIGVSGDSMEPTYHDGDLVYVEKRQIVEIGDVGVFMVNSECYIKEAGEEGLISHNEKYPMIPGGEHIICIGKVLGKVENA